MPYRCRVCVCGMPRRSMQRTGRQWYSAYTVWHEAFPCDSQTDSGVSSRAFLQPGFTYRHQSLEDSLCADRVGADATARQAQRRHVDELGQRATAEPEPEPAAAAGAHPTFGQQQRSATGRETATLSRAVGSMRHAAAHTGCAARAVRWHAPQTACSGTWNASRISRPTCTRTLTRIASSSLRQSQPLTANRSRSAQVGSYHSGGFVFDLPLNRTQADWALQQLQRDRWLDVRSRALFVEFALYAACRMLCHMPRVNSVVCRASCRGGMGAYAWPLRFSYSASLRRFLVARCAALEYPEVSRSWHCLVL